MRQVGVTALNVHMDNVSALLLVENNCFSDSKLGLVSGTRGEVVDARMLALWASVTNNIKDIRDVRVLEV